MNTQKIESNKREVMFTLSFFQILFNPPFVFLVRCGLTLLVVILSVGLAIAIYFLSQFGREDWWLLPTLCAGFIIFAYVWWLYLKSVFKHDYINCIAVEADALGFGRDEIQWWMQREDFFVRKGFCGVSIIHSLYGFGFIVPSNAISYIELKQLIVQKSI